jgi:RNA polymerase sigma-70 factor (ECF subfamily)
VQELYLRIVTLTRPEAVRDPRSFLYTSAKNLAIDYLRKKERALLRSQPLEEALTIPTDEPDAETTIDAKKRLAAVLKAIEELPARQRTAFVMFKFEHKTYEEIAGLLCISVRTVEHHISKAMAHCRRRFEAFEAS